MSELRNFGKYCQKALKRLRFIPSLPASLLLLLVVAALRPVVHFRFFVASQRIGHLWLAVLHHQEIRAVPQGNNSQPRRGHTFFLTLWESREQANLELAKQFGQDCGWKFLPRHVLVPAIYLARLIGMSSFYMYEPEHELLEVRRVHRSQRPPESQVNARLTDCYLNLVTSLGLREDVPVAAILTRSHDYLKATLGGELQRHSYRNCSIDNYESSIRFLTANNYQVIKVGRIGGDPLSVEIPGYCDYSISELQSDAGDLALAQCSSLIVSCSSGIDSIYHYHRVPMIGVNIPIVDARFKHFSVIMPKRMFVLRNENRIELPVISLTSPDMTWESSHPRWQGSPVIFQENSAEEVSEAVRLGVDLRKNPELRNEFLNRCAPYWDEFWNRSAMSNLHEVHVQDHPTLLVPNSVLDRFL